MVDPGESAETAAVRELREETGYVPRRIRLLGRVSPNPAIQNNHCYFYVAEGCRPAGPPHLDPFERIEVELHPVSEVPELVRQEQICHGLVINALGYLGMMPSGSPDWLELGEDPPQRAS
jgi:8-oxo-dGTP pyrophosphatase MutT (NUDIX family)